MLGAWKGILEKLLKVVVEKHCGVGGRQLEAEGLRLATFLLTVVFVGVP
jgi:hypothetical protein